MSDNIKPDECVVVERDGDLMFLRFDAHPSFSGWYYPVQLAVLGPLTLVGPFVDKHEALCSLCGVSIPEFNYTLDVGVSEYFSKKLKTGPLADGTHIHVKSTGGEDV